MTSAPVEDSTTTASSEVDHEADPFGRRIDVGPLDGLHDEIQRSGGFLFVPTARAWLVAYPEESRSDAVSVYPEVLHEGLKFGLLALHQKCPHLGCRVPDCQESQQFECPCHGSKYSNVGEYLDGPAPRGMDLFVIRVVDGRILIDTSDLAEGLPRGVNVTGWELVEDGCLSDLDS